MMFVSALTAAALALLSATAAASPIVQERQTAQGDFTLAIGGGRFDPQLPLIFQAFLRQQLRLDRPSEIRVLRRLR